MAVVSSSSSLELTRCTTTSSSSSSSSHCLLTEVPKDVLELVLRRLGNYSVWDFVRFGAVCRTLHRVKKNSCYNGFPAITSYSNRPFPLECHAQYSQQSLELVTSVYKKLFKSGEYIFVFGSSHGWLFLCPTLSSSIVLLDPPSGHRLLLPHPTSQNKRFYRFIPKKMILSSRPSSNNNVIAVALRPTFSHSLAFARVDVLNSALIGQWTHFEESSNQSPTYEDIIFWNEMLYAITRCGSLIAFDLNNIAPQKPIPIIVATFSNPHEKDKDIFTDKFLAKLHGDLLLISISWKRHFESPWLQIYKLDKSSTSTSTWNQIHRLGGGALFIGGRSHSISRLVSSNDQYCCIKKNCVYFLRPLSPAIYYVFNLEEGSVTQQDLKFISNGLCHLFWLDVNT